jgi:hypothetical protein
MYNKTYRYYEELIKNETHNIGQSVFIFNTFLQDVLET